MTTQSVLHAPATDTGDVHGRKVSLRALVVISMNAGKVIHIYLNFEHHCINKIQKQVSIHCQKHHGHIPILDLLKVGGHGIFHLSLFIISPLLIIY